VTIDWSTIAPSTHAGEAGEAHWRTVQSGASRVRIVDYSPGYTGDHWCERGHKTICLEGRFTVEYVDGTTESIHAGQSWCAPDGAPGHRIVTPSGAKLFIVD
jgi:quercetin dioxygenase-like cupin family protein